MTFLTPSPEGFDSLLLLKIEFTVVEVFDEKGLFKIYWSFCKFK